MIERPRGSASQSGSTNPYRIRACDGCSDLVGLDFVTNCYHRIDLSRRRPRDTFTNHYRREQGLGMTEYYVGLELIMCGAVDKGDVVLTFIG